MPAEKKKLHWTQTPEGKKKIAAVARKGHRTRRKNGHSQPKENAADAGTRPEEAPVAFATGYLTAWLEGYSRSARIPVQALTYRVGSLLRRQASR